MDADSNVAEPASTPSTTTETPERVTIQRKRSNSSESKRRMARDQAEILREQEVYKYSTIFNSLHILSDATSIRIRPDYALQTFAHFTALKTGMEYCILTLLDSRWQYVIAEGTLDTPQRLEVLEAPLLGSAMMTRETSVCEHLLCHEPDVPAATKLMIVPDLLLDERLSHLEYVVGKPNLRFYAGVPLLSPTKFIVGTIIVLSTKPNHNFGDAQLAVMRDMAGMVIDHLEFQRITENHRRGERMVKGLSLFVAGKSSIAEIDQPLNIRGSKSDEEKEKGAEQAGPKIARPSRSRPPSTDKIEKLIPKRSRIPSASSTAVSDTLNPTELKSGHSRVIGSSDAKDKSKEGNTSPKRTDVEVPRSIKSLFDRASKILSETLEVDIAFFDAAIGSFGGYLQTSSRIRHRKPPARRKKQAKKNPDSENEESADDTAAETDSTQSRSLSFTSNSSMAKTSGGTKEQRTSTVLGFCAGSVSSVEEHSVPQPLTGMREPFLQKLLSRYPEGKVFNLETLESLSSGEDSSGHISDPPPAKAEPPSEKQMTRIQRRRKRIEATELAALRLVFPDARAVLFCPLWDYQRERWFCAGFAHSKNPFRVLSNQEDLNFMTCFGNSIMSEVARIDAVTSDLAKTSFISSMSHELRSPLHGILASAELLRETTGSSYQSDLITSIDRCGAILLDSINHVLDFTKINTILTSKSAAAQIKRKDNLESLLRDIDLSVLIEESMEGIFSGFSHRNLFNEHDWISKSGESEPEPPTTFVKETNLFCILDIDWRTNWIFHTQPGAWTRIIVNLFGNALKYTAEGFIKVTLRVRPSRDTSSQTKSFTVDLIVSDSGQGMSHEFLRSRLFRPFSQEDNLAAGTGLGLSIVSQLVTALGGTIDVRSERSFGTDFKISAVLTETNNPTTQDETDPQPLSLANQVRLRTKGLKLCIVGFSKLEDDADSEDMPAVAKAKCLLSVESTLISMGRDWFGMEISTCKEMRQAVGDIVLVYESEFIAGEERRKAADALSPLPKTPGLGITVPLIVVCRSRKSFEKHSKENSQALKLSSQSIVELIPLPCGPHKFARVLALCLDRLETSSSRTENDYFSIPHSPTEDERGGLTPRPREILPTRIRTPEEKTVGGSQRSVDLSAARPTGLQRVSEDKVVTFQDSETSESEDSSTTDSDVDTDDSAKKGPKILLVDDNEINLRLLETRIKRDGFEYETASNGATAVEAYKAARGNFDIVFMDLNMPIMGGIEASRQIRSYEETNRVRPAVLCALTGLASDVAQKEAFDAGINMFLMKPASFQKIRAVIANWIQDHS